VSQKCGLFHPRKGVPTPLLHVSKEAQEESLEVFKPVFSSESSLYGGYVNVTRDILFLSDKIFSFRDAIKELNEDLLANVEELALDAFSLLFPRFPLNRGLEPLYKFRNLKVLILVMAHSPPKDNKIVLVEPFTIPIKEWRARGVDINDQTLVTEESKFICKSWYRGRVAVSRYILEGMERLLPVLADYAEKFPGWNIPLVEVKSLARSSSN
jgi:hypothetical protein